LPIYDRRRPSVPRERRCQRRASGALSPIKGHLVGSPVRNLLRARLRTILIVSGAAVAVLTLGAFALVKSDGSAGSARAAHTVPGAAEPPRDEPLTEPPRAETPRAVTCCATRGSRP